MLSIVTVSAKVIYDRSIVGTIINADPADSQLSELVESAEQSVGQDATSGNIKMTLDEVLSDDYAVYALMSFETLDGTPLAGAEYGDFSVFYKVYLDGVDISDVGSSGNTETRVD